MLLLAMVRGDSGAWRFVPGLLVLGLGLGTMLTPSVTIVQSAFPEALQGEISGLSRSVSNLGSCLGTTLAGTILVPASRPRRSGVTRWRSWPWQSSARSAWSPPCPCRGTCHESCGVEASAPSTPALLLCTLDWAAHWLRYMPRPSLTEEKT